MALPKCRKSNSPARVSRHEGPGYWWLPGAPAADYAPAWKVPSVISKTEAYRASRNERSHPAIFSSAS